MEKVYRSERVGNIDALRLFAAVCIVFYHSGYKLLGLEPFGAFSVLIFFNISGFFMAMAITEAPRQFLRRRLLRIVPSYWAITLLIFAVSEAAPHLFNSTRPHPVWLIKSLLFIPFAKAPNNLEPLVFVGWTLNCEVLFYLLLSLGSRISRRPILCATAMILTLMIGSSFFDRSSAIGFFYSRSSMLAFPLGMAMYSVSRSMTRDFARKWLVPSYIALFTVTLALCWMEGAHIDPYRIADSMYSPRPIIPQLLCLLLILALLILTKAGHDLRYSFLVLFAESTYVLYLAHAYILLAFLAAQRHLPLLLRMEKPLGFLSVLAVCCLTALAGHVFVERPCVAWLKTRFCTRTTSAQPRQAARPARISPLHDDKSAILEDTAVATS